MKVLLSGGAGFIGSFIAKRLLEDGDEVIIHDAFLNYVSPFESNYEKLLNLRFEGIRDKVEITRGDIRHKGRFLKILRQYNPDAVILLAALPIATVSNEYSEDAMGINLNGTVNVLESVREVPVDRLIYTSSSMIYGNFVNSPAKEEDMKEPFYVYFRTKINQ